MAERRPAARMQLVRVDEAGPAAPFAPRGTASGEPADGSTDAADRPPALVARRGVRRRWWVVAVAAVAALAVVWQLGAAHDRAYVRRISAVPGLVRPLDGTPSPLWRAAVLSSSSTIEAAAGRLVVAAPVGREVALVARDLTTGAQVWSRPVAHSLDGDTEGPDVTCPSDGTDVGPLVVCLVTPARSVYATAASRLSAPATTVLALAADDGRTLGRWTLAEPVFDAARVDDDVVLVTYDDDGYLTTQRRSATDGTTRWVARSGDQLGTFRPAPATTVGLHGGLLVVHGAGTLVLDTATGDVLLDEPSLLNMLVVPVGDDIATWQIGTGWLVRALDGTLRYRLPGAPAVASVDDGTSASLLVVDSGTLLRGLDPGDGHAVWSQPQVMNLVARVSHRLVVAGDNRWGVLDPRDGRPVWTVRLAEPVPWLPLSDGALVLGPGDTTDGALRLDAYHLADGAHAWSVALPQHVVDVDVFAGHLVVRTAGEVVVYG